MGRVELEDLVPRRKTHGTILVYACYTRCCLWQRSARSTAAGLQDAQRICALVQHVTVVLPAAGLATAQQLRQQPAAPAHCRLLFGPLISPRVPCQFSLSPRIVLQAHADLCMSLQRCLAQKPRPASLP